ncbi:MAG: aminotransferase class V-fold PLP-dependent enzyme [Thomasclavelia sp.]
MCGPTGIGILYGKYDLLQDTTPTRFGGGSNSRYNSCGLVTIKKCALQNLKREHLILKV